MAFDPISSLILGGSGLISGFLGGKSNEAMNAANLGMSKEVAEISSATSKELARLNARVGARRALPGQAGVEESLAPFLTERIGTGLTGKEQQVYRGAGRSAIETSLAGAYADYKGNAASQGLKGGAIASGLNKIGESKIPAFADLENRIAMMDIDQKNTNISQILQYLGLSAGMTDEQIEAAIAKMGGGTGTPADTGGAGAITNGIAGAGGGSGGGSGDTSGTYAGQIEGSVNSEYNPWDDQNIGIDYATGWTRATESSTGKEYSFDPSTGDWKYSDGSGSGRLVTSAIRNSTVSGVNSYSYPGKETEGYYSGGNSYNDWSNASYDTSTWGDWYDDDTESSYWDTY